MKTVNEAGKQWDVWFSSADGANIGVAFRIFCRPSLMRLINWYNFNLLLLIFDNEDDFRLITIVNSTC